jgi:TATA-binding protein-associated factor
MERAHRIGQKKVVNVYRIITRGTIEEKIMGLQQFKLAIANTVVDKENQSFQTMNNAQLLELFNLSIKESDTVTEEKQKKQRSETAEFFYGKQKELQTIINSLNEMWGETQYDEEYDINSFIEKLK